MTGTTFNHYPNQIPVIFFMRVGKSDYVIHEHLTLYSRIIVIENQLRNMFTRFHIEDSSILHAYVDVCIRFKYSMTQ